MLSAKYYQRKRRPVLLLISETSAILVVRPLPGRHSPQAAAALLATGQQSLTGKSCADVSVDDCCVCQSVPGMSTQAMHIDGRADLRPPWGSVLSMHIAAHLTMLMR